MGMKIFMLYPTGSQNPTGQLGTRLTFAQARKGKRRVIATALQQSQLYHYLRVFLIWGAGLASYRLTAPSDVLCIQDCIQSLSLISSYFQFSCENRSTVTCEAVLLWISSSQKTRSRCWWEIRIVIQPQRTLARARASNSILMLNFHIVIIIGLTYLTCCRSFFWIPLKHIFHELYCLIAGIWNESL